MEGARGVGDAAFEEGGVRVVERGGGKLERLTGRIRHAARKRKLGVSHREREAQPCDKEKEVVLHCRDVFSVNNGPKYRPPPACAIPWRKWVNLPQKIGATDGYEMVIGRTSL